MLIRVVALCLLAAACSPPPYTSGTGPVRDGMVRFEMADLEPSKAASAAQQAAARGDRYLLGAYGFAAFVPGAPDSVAPADWPHGVRYIEGTSDMIRGKAHMEFNNRAIAYARLYNLERLSHP